MIQKYKVGKDILSSRNKNQYYQYYDWYGMVSYGIKDIERIINIKE